MSIYHRYALYYNCLRYLKEVEKVKTFASRCKIIDDIQEKTSADSILGRKSRPTIVSKIPVQDKSSHDETDDKQTGIQHTKAEDNENNATGTDFVPCRGYGPSDSGLNAYFTPKLDSSKKESNTGGLDKFEGKPTSCTDGLSTSSLRVIRKSQFEKFNTFHQILATIVASLHKNIKRVEAESDCASTNLVSHLYYEAARLNGSEAAKTPRMQRLLGLNWWYSDLEGPSSPKEAPRRCNSPLLMAIDPDDLAWGDQVAQWQQDLGRDRDGQGRRLVKI